MSYILLCSAVPLAQSHEVYFSLKISASYSPDLQRGFEAWRNTTATDTLTLQALRKSESELPSSCCTILTCACWSSFTYTWSQFSKVTSIFFSDEKKKSNGLPIVCLLSVYTFTSPVLIIFYHKSQWLPTLLSPAFPAVFSPRAPPFNVRFVPLFIRCISLENQG